MDEIKHMMDGFYKIMEIYFDRQIIFPYAFLEGIQQRYDIYNDCNIYMLMLIDKLEIVSVKFKDKYFKVKYKNLVTKKKNDIRITYSTIWRIPIPRWYMKAKIENYKTILSVEITKKGKVFLKKQYPYIEEMMLDFKINIYDLLNICMKKEIIQEKMEVLYIGQSNPKKEYKTIFDRLKRHEKILEVFRRYNLEYRNKELMVFIGHAKSKLLNKGDMLFLSNSMWKEYDIVGEKIGEDATIDVSEAMLIYHFKPKFNIKLKDSIPSINQYQVSR